MLKASGCVEIFREHMSGAKASRPELARALARVRCGDVLVVATRNLISQTFRACHKLTRMAASGSFTNPP